MYKTHVTRRIQPGTIMSSSCKLEPPSKREDHDETVTLKSELDGKKIEKIDNALHVTEDVPKHNSDLAALIRGDIYSKDEFYKRAKTWYITKTNRLLHLDKAKQVRKLWWLYPYWDFQVEDMSSSNQLCCHQQKQSQAPTSPHAAEQAPEFNSEGSLFQDQFPSSPQSQAPPTPPPPTVTPSRSNSKTPTRIQPARAAKRKAAESAARSNLPKRPRTRKKTLEALASAQPDPHDETLA
ncbi:hypothetical protein N658DRAFT_164171 [Parathielavia hyrcaniae]|uniref:Uncharacterized protein n=1 Tax=Parathielavia hyrcaniae TaxID=113614 RepID=A0AAN6PZD1_9PEZI|nr:hypothetical protein N658DRAFT_164171 [Parathielavia hyrcaniae]